jgi:hypothetical protein
MIKYPSAAVGTVFMGRVVSVELIAEERVVSNQFCAARVGVAKRRISEFGTYMRYIGYYMGLAALIPIIPKRAYFCYTYGMKLPNVNILFAIIPALLFLLVGWLYLDRVMYIENSIKPYVQEQNRALDEYVQALSDANSNTTYNGVYVLQQLKGVVGTDAAAQKQAFENIINFKAKSAVEPPQVPDKINL